MHSYQKGDPVRVSNGEAEPPKHHTRKHAKWCFRNYDGFIHSVDSCGRVMVDESGKGALVRSHPPHQVTPRDV